MKKNDSYYMQQALALAKKGMGKVDPNPLVGCVIVCDGKIIGEGYHEKYGGLHAEPNAVNSVENNELISQSTVYITLEPCAHVGKTPPCADLLASLKPNRVVICNNDPNPLVAGKGIQKILAAGIKVTTGVLAIEGKELNKRFFTFQEKKRPYIILKWAQTADGFIARENYDSKWISNEDSRTLVHQWRAEEAGIMVGTNTALHDNPQLNVRHVTGKNPTRIVIDKTLRLPKDFHLIDQSQPTIIYNQEKNLVANQNQFVKLDFSQNIVPQVLHDLFDKNITSVLIEGGKQLLDSFIDTNLWDEAKVFIAPSVYFQSGIAAPVIQQKPLFEELIKDDKLLTYINQAS